MTGFRRGKRALVVAVTALAAAGGAVLATGVGDAGADISDGFSLVVAPPMKVLSEERSPDGSVRKHVRFGPITAAPGSGDDHGGGDPGHGGMGPMHGPTEPMHGTHTMVWAPMLAPCTNCYITSSDHELVNPDGSEANVDTGVMLHHVVQFDKSRQDVSCGRTGVGLAGRRIFSSGNERVPDEFPPGYGVKVGLLPLFHFDAELMNMSSEPKQVYFDITTTHVPAGTPGMREVTPLWLDLANCGTSTHSVPVGEWHRSWDWTSTIAGTVKAVGGHLHDGGQSLTLSDQSTGATICQSTARYGTRPQYLGHLDWMTPCVGQDVGRIARGDTLRLDSHYHSGHADDHAMSIMTLYVAEQE